MDADSMSVELCSMRRNDPATVYEPEPRYTWVYIVCLLRHFITNLARGGRYRSDRRNACRHSAQSVDVNRGGAHWVRIVGRAVMLSKADGYQERQPQKEGVQ